MLSVEVCRTQLLLLAEDLVRFDRLPRFAAGNWKRELEITRQARLADQFQLPSLIENSCDDSMLSRHFDSVPVVLEADG